MSNTYKTELEARLHYVAKFMRYSGITEGSKEHKELVDDYNKIRPLPRGYTASYSDDWCALSLCGQGYELGYRTWPFECSCPRIADAAKAAGRWRKPGQTPEIGEWCLYDWEPNGAPNHIGVVVWVENGEVWVSEGNYSDSHKIRRLKISDGRIYGYVMLDFMELVEQEENAMLYKTVEDVPEYGRAVVQRLVKAGIIRGYDDERGLGLDENLVRTLVFLDRAGKI